MRSLSRFSIFGAALLLGIAVVVSGLAWAGEATPTTAPKAEATTTATPSPVHTMLKWVGSHVAKGEATGFPSTQSGENAWRGWFAGGKDVPLAALRDALVADGWNADRTVGFFMQVAERSGGCSEKGCSDCPSKEETGSGAPAAKPAADKAGSGCSDCDGKACADCPSKGKDCSDCPSKSTAAKNGALADPAASKAGSDCADCPSKSKAGKDCGDCDGKACADCPSKSKGCSDCPSKAAKSKAATSQASEKGPLADSTARKAGSDCSDCPNKAKDCCGKKDCSGCKSKAGKDCADCPSKGKDCCGKKDCSGCKSKPTSSKAAADADQPCPCTGKPKSECPGGCDNEGCTCGKTKPKVTAKAIN